MQPWSMLPDWNAFWGRQWKVWFDAVVSAPNPWLPALAEGRPDQSAAIDFFLPWLPRIEAVVTPLDPAGEKDAVRVMLRAALPHVGSGEQTEWLNVDATVSRATDSTAAMTAPAEPLAPPELPVLDASPTTTEPAAKPAAPKRRTRKPAASKSKAGSTPAGE